MSLELNPLDSIELPPGGYQVRAAERSDAPRIAALIAACERADGLATETSAEEVLSDLLGVDLAQETVLVSAPDGQLAAYADLSHHSYRQVSVYGYVHPQHRGRGLGRSLVQWGEEWARAYRRRAPQDSAPGGLQVQHFIPTANESGRRLLEAHGYEPIRTHYWMEIEFEQRPPAPSWPPGLSVRHYAPGEDDEALYQAGEEAFADMWERAPGSLESWTAPTRDEAFDPSLWFLVEDDASGQIAAFALCLASAEHGTVGSLGVRRPWRRHGLGMALLHHAFGAFYERGLRKAGLSVDSESPTGAPRLYRRAGMHVVQSYTRYRKQLLPGQEEDASRN